MLQTRAPTVTVNSFKNKLLVGWLYTVGSLFEKLGVVLFEEKGCQALRF